MHGPASHCKCPAAASAHVSRSRVLRLGGLISGVRQDGGLTRERVGVRRCDFGIFGFWWERGRGVGKRFVGEKKWDGGLLLGCSWRSWKVTVELKKNLVTPSDIPWGIGRTRRSLFRDVFLIGMLRADNSKWEPIGFDLVNKNLPPPTPKQIRNKWYRKP
jgi:hypothetical protein